MDKRRKLTDAQVNEVKAMLTEGVKGDAVARTFGVSTTHVYRIQAAMRNGEVKLKRSSLDSCMELIKTGLPFRRAGWENDFYYFYDTEKSWFVRHEYMGDHGDDYDMIEYTLRLDLEDLMAKDWIVLTWESVK
jgi:hypothetical protein